MADISTQVTPSATDAQPDYIQKYQNALDTLSNSLSQRPAYDPVLMGMAQGFLSPTKTGAFGESVGNAIGQGVNAQQVQQQEAQKNATLGLQLAQGQFGAGQQMQSQQMLKDMLGSFDTGTKVAPTPAGPVSAGPTTPGLQTAVASPVVSGLSSIAPSTTQGAPQSAPQGALTQASMPSVAPVAPMPSQQAPRQQTNAPLGGSHPLADPLSSGISSDVANGLGFGYQAAPAQPNMPTSRQHILAGLSSGAKPSEVLKQIQESQKEETKATNEGIFVPRTGMFYPYDKGTTQEITLPGDTGPRKIPTTDVQRLNKFATEGNNKGYYDLVKRIQEGPPRPTTENENIKTNPVGTSEIKVGESRKIPSITDTEIMKAQAIKRAEATISNEKDFEKTVPSMVQNNDNLVHAANSVYKHIEADPKGFGLFDTPGLMSAFTDLITSAKDKGGVFDADAFNNAALKVLPKNVSQSTLNHVKLVASDLANIELAYAKNFLKGEGSVTESERRIAKIAGVGNVSTNPEVLKLRSLAVKYASEFNRDFGNLYMDYKIKNPDGTQFDFYRNYKPYQELYAQYNKNLDSISGVSSTKDIKRGPKDLEGARKRAEEALR